MYLATHLVQPHEVAVAPLDVPLPPARPQAGLEQYERRGPRGGLEVQLLDRGVHLLRLRDVQHPAPRKGGPVDVRYLPPRPPAALARPRACRERVDLGAVARAPGAGQPQPPAWRAREINIEPSFKCGRNCVFALLNVVRKEKKSERASGRVMPLHTDRQHPRPKVEVLLASN